VANLLVVEPDASAADLLLGSLAADQHACRHVTSAAQALAALEADHYDAVITELKLPSESGVELLIKVLRGWPGVAVVMVASAGTVAEAVEAMKRGAADFLEKPFASDDIRYVVRKAVASVAASAEQPPSSPLEPGAALVSQSESMHKVRETIRRAASTSTTVLVRGETGTGKELVARAVHEASARRGQPFVKIDCAALPESLLDSELFGYERGAFTGASGRKPGRVELADGGTIFLDECGEVSLALQAKLLRLVQDRAFEKLGGKNTQHIDARFVLATHRDLDVMVENGSFRQDLFYRINVFPLWLPPLRARRDDIELLAKHFCARFAETISKPSLAFSAQALKFLRSQRWPGNVRQLENFIERLVLLSDGPVIDLALVEGEFVERPRFVTQSTGTTGHAMALPSSSSPLDEAKRKVEKDELLRALAHSGGNRSAAARLLSVSRATLYNKLKDHGIERH
jgi:two-component system response regulator AtoC